LGAIAEIEVDPHDRNLSAKALLSAIKVVTLPRPLTRGCQVVEKWFDFASTGGFTPATMSP
jgi:hypothetical protein